MRRLLIVLSVIAVLGVVLFAISCAADDEALRHSV